MVETINKRIKLIRKHAKLRQADFADLIGVKRVTVSWLEQDGNTVVEQNKRIICDKFHISMHWLETGNGNMYSSDVPEDVFSRLRGDLNLSSIEEKILRGYFDLDDRSRKAVNDFIVNIGRSISSEPARPQDQEDRTRMHELLDAELNAEEKDASASTNTSLKRA